VLRRHVPQPEFYDVAIGNERRREIEKMLNCGRLEQIQSRMAKRAKAIAQLQHDVEHLTGDGCHCNGTCGPCRTKGIAQDRVDCEALEEMLERMNARIDLAERQLENSRKIHAVRSAVLDAGGDMDGYELDESERRLQKHVNELMAERHRFLRDLFCVKCPDHQACRI
jgi:hypothetical protein